MVAPAPAPTEERIWQLLAEVADPEVPVLSILDLGIVRAVQVLGEAVSITITPTYSGCPAMSTIATDIRLRLLAEGITRLTIHNQLSPAWTTAWMSEAGRHKLEAYGIAPPLETAGRVLALFEPEPVLRCPLCQSTDTHLVSQFGSTACKALYQCNSCQEPFDYFKCH
jgi:ring-1,2-phenylacetyl-CoA epoxidase subunit PaaD